MAKGGGFGLSCGAKFVKICLIVFNFLFFLLGLLILAIGIYVLVDPKFAALKNIANVPQQAAQAGLNLTYIDKCGIAFIVFGGVMFLISFMGCCGALRHIRCLLGLYGLVLLVILAAEIGIGVFAGIYSGEMRTTLTPLLKDSIRTQYMGDMQNKTLTSIAWDATMYNLRCCGVSNQTVSNDFNQPGNVWTDRNGTNYPRACCKFTSYMTDWSGVVPNNTVDGTCNVLPNAQDSNYQVGCYDQVNTMINTYSGIVIGVAIGIGLILFLGVIFAFCLCKKVGDLDDYA